MLARFAPGPVVRFFARPYVAGESLDAALELARKLRREQGLVATLDLLGEAVADAAEIQSNVEMYRRTIEGIAADVAHAEDAPWPAGIPKPDTTGIVDSLRPSVSLKPTAFTTGPMADATGPITELCEYAHEKGIAVTIDMEDRRYTDDTIELATGLFARGLDVGTVLQTRLFRTPKDLDRIPAGMRLRLVIGIYPEPEEVAHQKKRRMKEEMLKAAAHLLARDVFVEFATHDERYLARFLREVAPAAPERCELQMLLGVPRERFIGRMRKGEFGPVLPTRLYVPFADNWDDATAYLRRRMAESPSMVWLVLRNLLPRRRGPK